jgi:hypothetical protein
MKHRRTSHLARVILLTLPLFLAIAAPVRAQDPITSSMLGPFLGGYNYAGGGSCSPDVVAFVGTAHVMCQVPTSLTGTVTCYINLLADRGIGATGLPYHAVGEAQATCPKGAVCRLSTNTYKVIPDPACPQTTMTVEALVTFDESGHIAQAVFSPAPISP